MPENLTEYVRLHGGEEALRDLDRMVEKAMNEIKSEAQMAIDQAFFDANQVIPKKRFKSLI